MDAAPVIETFLRVGSRYVRIGSIAYVELLPSGRIQIVLQGPHSDPQKVDVDPHEAERVRRFCERLSVNGVPAEGERIP